MTTTEKMTTAKVAEIIEEALIGDGLEAKTRIERQLIIIDAVDPRKSDPDRRIANSTLTYVVQDNGVIGPDPDKFGGKRRTDSGGLRVDEELLLSGFRYNKSSGMYEKESMES